MPDTKRIAFIKYGDAVNEYLANKGMNFEYVIFDSGVGYFSEIFQFSRTYNIIVISYGDRYCSIKDGENIYSVIPANRAIQKYLICQALLFFKLILFRPAIIVSIGTPFDAFILWIISKFIRAKLIPFLAGEFYVDYGNKLFRRITDKLAVLILRRDEISIVAARSEFVKRQLIERGISESKIIVYTLRYDKKFFVAHNVEEIFNENSFKVLFIGRFVKRKGIYTFLNIAKELNKMGLTIKFVMIGDGPEIEKIRKFIFDYGLENKVFVLGPRPHSLIYSYLRKSELICIPSYNESFCKVAYEALLSGTPIIASKIGALEEFVEDGKNGYLISPDDIKSFCDRIVRFFFNPDLLNAMKKNSVQKSYYIKQYLTPTEIIVNYINQ